MLIIETSEELLPARNVGWIVRSLGERGILGAVLVARPPVSDFTRRPPADERARLRAEQRDVVVEVIARYNPDAVVCVGVPFGHTRPQWILPHGGPITVNGAARRVLADFSWPLLTGRALSPRYGRRRWPTSSVPPGVTLRLLAPSYSPR